MKKFLIAAALVAPLTAGTAMAACMPPAHVHHDALVNQAMAYQSLNPDLVSAMGKDLPSFDRADAYQFDFGWEIDLFSKGCLVKSLDKESLQ